MIKSIDDDNLPEFQELYYKMFKSIDYSVRRSQVLLTLASDISKPNFRAFGYYYDNVMVGFTSGYQESNHFCFTGIYSERKTIVKELIDNAENDVKKLGLNKWVTIVNGDPEASIVPKLGTKMDYAQYSKDL